MKTFLDTSVLVAAITDQLPNHPAAFACFASQVRMGAACTSAHALAECYATLTALPLPRRISGPEAQRLIESNFREPRLRILVPTADDYRKAIAHCAGLGALSGQIYDALHLFTAARQGCSCVFTYNIRHFQSLAMEGISVSSP